MKHYQRAAGLREQGRFDEALDSFRKALGEDEGLARAWMQIANIKKYTVRDDDVAAMESMYARSDISDAQRMYLAFGLGKASEDLGQYAEAFDFFAAGNGIKRTALGYPPEEQAVGVGKIARAIGLGPAKGSPIPKIEANFKLVRSLFENFPFDNYAGSGCLDDTPIFIVGMPRSGTTLVEQILASHSQVHGAGELYDLASIGGTFLNGFRETPVALRQCDAADFARVGVDYVAAIKPHARKARFITDKMPENFLLVGLIALVLPNARVIHCRRDPRDTCTSIFKQSFAARDGLEYAYDLDDLGRYYRLYHDLMSWWQTLLPGFIYTLNYEELVVDQAQQTKDLLAHCRLEWEDACLTFHETERAIKTRAEQARRPMYASSVQSWKRYETQMKSLFKALP